MNIALGFQILVLINTVVWTYLREKKETAVNKLKAVLKNAQFFYELSILLLVMVRFVSEMVFQFRYLNQDWNSEEFNYLIQSRTMQRLNTLTSYIIIYFQSFYISILTTYVFQNKYFQVDMKKVFLIFFWWGVLFLYYLFFMAISHFYYCSGYCFKLLDFRQHLDMQITFVRSKYDETKNQTNESVANFLQFLVLLYVLVPIFTIKFVMTKSRKKEEKEKVEKRVVLCENV